MPALLGSFASRRSGGKSRTLEGHREAGSRDASSQANYGNVPYLVPWANLALIFTVVMVVALGTTYLPARRASRVFPAEALRYQ